MSDELAGAIAEAEGGRFVEAFGTAEKPNRYEVADKIGLMPMMKFAHLAKKGVDSLDMEALVVMYDLVRGVLTDEAWDRFEQDATDARADGDELFAIVTKAISVIAARPTTRPSDSSAGPSTTTASLTDSSSSVERRRALGLVPVTDLLAV